MNFIHDFIGAIKHGFQNYVKFDGRACNPVIIFSKG